MRAPLGTSDNPLISQAENHRAIAAWCDKAAGLIQEHGQAAVKKLNGWLPDTMSTYASQWLSPLVYDRLVCERNAHLQCAVMLESYADSLNETEANLTSAQK